MADQEAPGRVELTVPDELGGERADKVLARLLGISRAAAKLLFDQGVIVDGAAVRPGEPLSGGAVILSPSPAQEAVLSPEPVPFGVLYEDDDMAVVDKPAGVVSHPGAGRATGTLASGLLHRYPSLEGVGEPGRWGMVHRLDRDTSGAMLVALTSESYRILSTRMRERRVTRTYTALVDGVPSAPTGTVDAPLGRHPMHPTRRAVIQGGRPARTHFEVEASFPEKDCSLLSVWLETGRTHQIRVHLAAIGHPVVGDKVYRSYPSRVEAGRTFLHARSVELSHPVSDEQLLIESPLPADLGEVLVLLGDPGSV